MLLVGIASIHIHLGAQLISIESPVNMLTLGDSYTIGESVDSTSRWPHQFVAGLRNEGIEASDPDYIAVTGWTTQDLLAGIDRNYKREKQYNLVSILIGVNNQYQGIPISTYEPDLVRIIELALEMVKGDRSKVFMLSIPDYAFTPFGKGNEKISREIDAYNAINRQLALSYHLTWVDVTPVSRKGLDDPSLVAGDGLHPSALQYEKWIREIKPWLNLPF